MLGDNRFARLTKFSREIDQRAVIDKIVCALAFP